MRYRRGLTNPCRFCGRPTTGTLCGDHLNAMRPKVPVDKSFIDRVSESHLRLRSNIGKYARDRQNQEFYEAHAATFLLLYNALRDHDESLRRQGGGKS